MRRLLLKSMDNPQIDSNLDGIDDPKRIPAKGQSNFQNSCAQAMHRLSDVRLGTFCGDCQRREANRLCFGREFLEFLASRPDPRYGPSLERHWIALDERFYCSQN